MLLPCTTGPCPDSLLSPGHLWAEHVHKRDGNHKPCLPGSINQPLSELLSAAASSATDCSSPANLGPYLQGNTVHRGLPHFCGSSEWKLVAMLTDFQVIAMVALLEKGIQHFVELVMQIRQMLVITIHKC